MFTPESERRQATEMDGRKGSLHSGVNSVVGSLTSCRAQVERRFPLPHELRLHWSNSPLPFMCTHSQTKLNDPEAHPRPLQRHR